MRGAHLASDQDAGLALFGMRKAIANDLAEAIAAGNALDRMIDLAARGVCVLGRTFAFPCSMASYLKLRVAGFLGTLSCARPRAAHR